MTLIYWKELTERAFLTTDIAAFLDSSAVEQSTVNRLVAGSNPAQGAIYLIFHVHQRSFIPREPLNKSRGFLLFTGFDVQIRLLTAHFSRGHN